MSRSSSASGPEFSSSQGRQSQGKAPVVTSRASSADGRGRASSIGGFRPSICNFKTNDGKTVTPADLASDILKVLQDLDFKHMPVSMKILQLPSTALFYSIFEFFLKHVGIEDVWNSDYLPQTAPPQKGISSVVAQNKLRVELIIFYLEVLMFPNVPKPTVLQTMTTPKNWTHMLQIMQFLAHNCWFLVCYDSTKVMNQYSGNFKTNQMIYDYIKHAYSQSNDNLQFIGSEQHKKMKADFLNRYQQHMRGDYNLKEMEDTKTNEKKKLEYLVGIKEGFENSIKEERELINTVNENEKLLNKLINENEEKKKRINMKKQRNLELQENLKRMEEEIAVKDRVYDKQMQMLSGHKNQNIVKNHSQKSIELDALQTAFVDLEEKKDELQMLLMNKTQEVKSAITGINSIVKKIKLCSLLEINEFPQFNLVDFHKKSKQDIIKSYKDSLAEIRNQFNASVCQLPEQLSQSQSENILIKKKIGTGEAEISKLEKEINEVRETSKNIQRQADHDKEKKRQQLAAVNQELNKLENEESQFKEELRVVNDKLRNTEDSLRRIKEDQIKSVKLQKDSYMHTEKAANEQLTNYEKQCITNIEANYSALEGMQVKMREFRNELANIETGPYIPGTIIPPRLL